MHSSKVWVTILLFAQIAYIKSNDYTQVQPNIIIVLGDDMGWNDISAHGSNQILTPNIDAVGFNGVIFKRHYTMHLCTPSRSALLTGIHPIKSGMQGYPIDAGEPRALPIHMSTLPEKLQDLGYSTHLVGKWHLGHENRSVTPTGRGFHSHLGYWDGFVGYFDYESVSTNKMKGLDLHRNFRPAYDLVGKYATDVFTDAAVDLIKNHEKSNPLFLMINHLAAHTGKDGTELGVPSVEEAMEKYAYIEEPQRRLYAEVVNRLDDSIGKVMRALADRGMLKDSIVVFMSDNGAQTQGIYENFGSNWPLRGLKSTLYEGGVRNAAVMWSNRLHSKQRVENTMVHITDWMPTLYAAAGGYVNELGNIDGVNHWPMLSSDLGSHSRTKDVLLNIDDFRNYEAIISADGRFKLATGTNENGAYDGYFGDSGRNGNEPEYNISGVLHSDANQAILESKSLLTSELTAQHIIQLRSNMEINHLPQQDNITCLNGHYCLFDLHNDPTETTDISTKHPDVVAKLTTSINAYRKEMIPQRNKPSDPASDPKYCNGTWFTWLDPVIKCEM